MKRPNHVTTLAGYRIEVSYPDGVTGVIDLSDSVGKGIFAPLRDEKFFKTVHIGEFGQIMWSDEIEICSDAAYLEIADKKNFRTDSCLKSADFTASSSASITGNIRPFTFMRFMVSMRR